VHALKRHTEETVRFTEEKHLQVLSSPLVLHGTLVFRPPDEVEKHVTAPYGETYRIRGDELSIERPGAGGARHVALADYPGLAALASGFRGVLGGDYLLLQRHYRMTLHGQWSRWELDLTPLAASARKFLRQIRVYGRHRDLERFELQEPGGDRTVIRIDGPGR